MENVRQATENDAITVGLASDLRKADRAEILASSGREPVDALLQGVKDSARSWAIEIEGDVLSVFGFVTNPINRDIGHPWLLARDQLFIEGARERAWFIKNSNAIVNLGRPLYTNLYGAIDSRNAGHIRWLRHCGFLIGGHKWTKSEVPFLEFSKEYTNNV